MSANAAVFVISQSGAHLVTPPVPRSAPRQRLSADDASFSLDEYLPAAAKGGAVAGEVGGGVGEAGY